MDPTVCLSTWRTPPHSSQSFHNVDKLVPVVRMQAPEGPWALASEPRCLEDLVLKDQTGLKRNLAQVLESTATRGLVVLRRGALISEWYGQGYDGQRPHILFSVSKSLTGALAGVLIGQGLLDPVAVGVDGPPLEQLVAHGDQAGPRHRRHHGPQPDQSQGTTSTVR